MLKELKTRLDRLLRDGIILSWKYQTGTAVGGHSYEEVVILDVVPDDMIGTGSVRRVLPCVEAAIAFAETKEQHLMASYTPFGLTELDLKRAKEIASTYASNNSRNECEEAIVNAMASLVKDRDDVFRVVMARNMGDPVPEDIAEETVRIADEIATWPKNWTV